MCDAGLVQFVILGLLLTGPLSLYDVRRHFSAGISLFYSASFGSLQRALRGLLADGSVTVSDAEGARGRKLYAITEQGRERWRAWMLAPIPDGSQAETLALAKVYLLGRLDDETERRTVLDTIRESVTSALGSLGTLAAELDGAAATVPESLQTAFAYQRATLAYGVRAHEVLVDWIDEVRGA